VTHRILPFSLSVMLLPLLACSSEKGEATEPAKVADSPGKASDEVVVLTRDQLTHAGLRAAKIEARQASATIKLPGTLVVDPRASWRVSPTVDGVVEQVGAVANDVVKKGQMLARLRSTALGEAQVASLEARATLRLATAERQRNLPLRKNGVVSEGQWLRVDHAFQQAQGANELAERKLALNGMSRAQIEGLEVPGRKLGELTLASPAAGVVLAASVSRGQALAAGAEAFEIADLAKLWVIVHIPVASLRQLLPGAKATVHVTGRPGASWEGELGSLGSKVDADAQTLEGRVVVSNDDGFLRPGMFAEVDVVGAAVPALMVPSSATFSVGNETYVFQKLADAKFRPLPVKVAPELGDWTPISGAGVAAGVEVVIAGVAELKSHWLYEKEE